MYFVPADGHQVNPDPLRIYAQLSIGLDSVHMDQGLRILFFYDLYRFFYRLYRSDLVIDMHQGNQNCFLCHRFL